ncbi:MAG TPA: hypothetical protein VL752_14730 [Acidisoma sp.]|uniref:hypothetical protein n=1 Tax=Acidisoma sp. TaxID=1872115 RepID=UPI002B846977|nr:hypothetical protein [Acidisoma sp.]HTI02202.1 hypothetical protein [Acidisoma sp.]
MMRSASRLLAVLLTIWSLATILPDLSRIVTPLGSYGLSVDNDGTIIGVQDPFIRAAASPAGQAGLAPGMQLDLTAMRCTRPGSEGCRAILAVLGDFGGVEYTASTRPITLTLRPGDGLPARQAVLHPAPAPLPFAAKLVLLLDTVVGAAFVFVAFRLVWDRPGGMTWGFFLYAIWFNPGQNYTYYALLQLWPPGVLVAQTLDSLAQGAAYAGLVAFALCFPEEAPGPGGVWIGRLLPVLALAMVALAFAASANLFGFETRIPAQIQFFTIIPLDILAIALLAARRRHLAPQDEARMRWVLAGYLIGLPAFLAAELCQSTNLPERLLGFTPSLAEIGLLCLLQGVIAYFVGTAVRRRRVVAVSIPLRRGAILACLSFVLGVPIVYLHDTVSSIGDHMHETLHLPAWLWLAVVSPIALIVLTHLHHHSVTVLERAFNRRYHKAHAQLTEAGQSMLTVRGFDEVDRLVTEHPTASLRLVSAAIFRQQDGQFRRSGAAPGWPEQGPSTLDPSTDGAVLRCLETGEPVALPRGGWHRPGLPSDDFAPCLAVPIRGGVAESLGVALFGPHVTGSDINRDERRLLAEFADRAALGYDRVEVEILRRALDSLRRELRDRPESERISG